MLPATFQVAKYAQNFFSFVIPNLPIFDAVVQITNIATDGL